MGSNEANKSAKEKETKVAAAATTAVCPSALVTVDFLVAFSLAGCESC